MASPLCEARVILAANVVGAVAAGRGQAKAPDSCFLHPHQQNGIEKGKN